jgi:hypothetical protein
MTERTAQRWVLATVFAAQGSFATPSRFDDGLAPALAVAAAMSLADPVPAGARSGIPCAEVFAGQR